MVVNMSIQKKFYKRIVLNKSIFYTHQTYHDSIPYIKEEKNTTDITFLLPNSVT